MSGSLPALSSPAAAHQAPALSVALEQVAEHLSAPQNEALSALLAGETIKDAAELAGVHRVTVHRWITGNPLFRAAYNAWQLEARESAKVKLLSLTQTAIEIVSKAISTGNTRLAYNLLKDLGMLAKLKDGLTDPNLVQKQIQLDHANLLRALSPEPEPASPPQPHPSPKPEA